MTKKVKYGKPSGLTLRAHTDNVKTEAHKLIAAFSFWAWKYQSFFGEDLGKLLKDAAEYHDYGKAYPAWREACAKDVERYHGWLRSRGFSTKEVNRELHERYEEECYKHQKAAAPNLMKLGLRHEFASVDWLRNNQPNVAESVVTAIAAHHGKLSHREYAERRWREDGSPNKGLENGPYYRYFKNFRGKANRFSEQESFEDIVRRRYRYAAARALLQISDTRASRREGMGEGGMVPLLPFRKPKGFGKGSNLRPVQQAAVDAASQWRTILRAPTGSGKTYASLLWAEQQILGPNPRADRLVIAMPTRFTSNALRKAVAEQLPDLDLHGDPKNLEPQVGLYHSSAFFNLYGEDGDDSRGSFPVERQKYARYLATPVTVCTIDHLLACLTGSREQHYSTFFFLANSCVVFDETDFYDEFVQANIQTLLDVLEVLKVPTLIMSATVPDSARSLYRVKTPIQEASQPGAERVNKQLRYLGEAEKPERVADFLGKMLTAGQGIIYANTVARALDYYGYLQARVGDVPLTIYHSRFTEPHKDRIERELEASLGKKAHDEDRARGIVIMTQIGEMSINISSHLMLTDCCPWDRLAQRIGRLARFATAGSANFEATVGLVAPINNEGEPYAWPYVELDPASTGKRRRVYRPVDAYTTTLKEVREFCASGSYRLTPKVLVERTNALYQKRTEFSTATEENQRNYRRLIQQNWLLTGAVNNNDEDTKMTDWQSRNIADQVTVFVQVAPPRFYSFKAFQDFALKHGVSCPVYKVKSELRKKDGDDEPALHLASISIGPPNAPPDRVKPVRVYCAVKGAYNDKTGLASLYGYAWKADHFL